MKPPTWKNKKQQNSSQPPTAYDRCANPSIACLSPCPRYCQQTSLLAEGHVDQVGVLHVILPLELQLVRVQRSEVLLGLLSRGGSQSLRHRTKQRTKRFAKTGLAESEIRARPVKKRGLSGLKPS